MHWPGRPTTQGNQHPNGLLYDNDTSIRSKTTMLFLNASWNLVPFNLQNTLPTRERESRTIILPIAA